ncbi:MAG: polysaccharide biosynthesis/export family protein [Flavipsychrobacter sp.]|nr:polysaccharide biosynthesis/export family protein [Flavipsychrobacter sp.]
MIRLFQVSLYSLVAVSLLIFSSCVNTKKITYFNNIPDTNYVNAYEIGLAQYSDPKIQPNDILQVTVQTLDPQATNMMGVQTTSSFSIQSASSASGGTGTAIQGYMVDGNGFISIPLVGKLQVNGLSTTEVKDLIEKRAILYYKNPVVNVRFVNFTVTVLGEVAHPGQINIPNEKTSIFDVIGAAGDMSAYAKRDNVLVIREENGVKKFLRLNLYRKDVFQSPYFYLHQRDVVYVAPNKSKAITSNAREARILSLVSITVTFLTFLLYFRK